MRPITRHRRLSIAVAVLALLALAGCGGSRHASSKSASHGAATGGVAVNGANGSAASGSGADDNLPAKAPDTATSGSALSSTPLQQRAVVRTGTLSVTVANVDQAADSALAATKADGGRVDGDDRNEDSTGRHAELVLRVPAAKLDDLRDTVSRLGHEDNRSMHGADVTASQADIDGRVQELTISVGRLQDYLKHSGSISELVTLESQLTQRESELQSTVEQQKALSDQVELATLTVDLHGKAAVVRTQSGPAGFGSAVWKALGGLLLSLRWLAALLGYLLPFLVVLAIPGVPAALWWRRTRRNRRPITPEPATD